MDVSGDLIEDRDADLELTEFLVNEQTNLADFEDDLNTSNIPIYAMEMLSNGSESSFEIIDSAENLFTNITNETTTIITPNVEQVELHKKNLKKELQIEQEPENIKVELEEPEKIEVRLEYPEKMEVEQEEHQKIKVEQEEPEKIKVEPEEPEKIQVEPEEPEKIKVEPEVSQKTKIELFVEEQKIRLEKKDAEEEKKKEELRLVAKKELEEWYKINSERISIAKATNRKQSIPESDEIEPGTEWDRISKLCNFNAKSSHKNKDKTRMKYIILKLHQAQLKKPISKSPIVNL